MSGLPILYGINLINGSLVMFDRFQLNNYNSVILATSGAGKSYFVKLEAIRYMALGTKVMIIDPQGEYKRIAEVLGGQYIKLSSNSDDRINPLDLQASSEEEDDGKNFLTQKILDVYAIVEVMMKRKLTSRERKVLLNALEDTYRRFNITREKNSLVTDEFVTDDEVFVMKGSRKKMPTLTDLEKALRRYEEGTQIADDLDPYINGFLDLFNGESNVNPNSPFLVFDISEMEKELGDVAMFIVLEFLWGKIKSGDKSRRLLIVDEAWMMMNNPQSAEFLVRVAKTARKFYAGLTMISQQARDFLANDGEQIIGNTSMQVLLRQHPNDVQFVAKMFGLSESEMNVVRNAAKGEALIFASGNHTAVSVVSHELEHVLCSTDPSEKELLEDIIAEIMAEEEEEE